MHLCFPVYQQTIISCVIDLLPPPGSVRLGKDFRGVQVREHETI
jgi:hypothetical protein